jgi:hypothetical protein
VEEIATNERALGLIRKDLTVTRFFLLFKLKIVYNSEISKQKKTIFSQFFEYKTRNCKTNKTKEKNRGFERKKCIKNDFWEQQREFREHI